MSEPKRVKRQIETIAFDMLSDGAADTILRNSKMCAQHKSSYNRSPFHIPNTPLKYRIMVHDFVGEPDIVPLEQNTEMFLCGSHKYNEFFMNVKRFLFPQSNANAFPNMTLQKLNAIVAFLKTGIIHDAVCLKANLLKQQMTEDQIRALPDRFQAFLLPVDRTFLAIIDTRTVKLDIFSSNDNALRYKFMFECVEGVKEMKEVKEVKGVKKVEGIKEPDVSPEPPETKCHTTRFERRRMKCVYNPQALWPQRLHPDYKSPELQKMIQNSLDTYGVACIPLSHQHIYQYTEKASEYVAKIIGIKDPTRLLDWKFMKHEYETNPEWVFRKVGSTTSRHIQVLSGKTSYGRYCTALDRLFHDIQFIIRCAFPPKQDVWCTNVDIFIQF